jgi:hypothetical protein
LVFKTLYVAWFSQPAPIEFPPVKLLQDYPLGDELPELRAVEKFAVQRNEVVDQEWKFLFIILNKILTM